MYESLTKYLLEFPSDEKSMWIIDKENDGTLEHPIQMPYVNYSRLVRDFTDDVYSFVDKHEEMGLRSYAEILKEMASNGAWIQCQQRQLKILMQNVYLP